MMAGKHPTPFWNRDAIMAAGLAFAGLAVLQSKLLPGGGLEALRSASAGLLADFVDPRFLHWWPALLIVAGAGIWMRSSFLRRSARYGNPAAQGRGSK